MLEARIESAGYAEGRPVLGRLAIDVPPGRLVALLGANGAGKTTTLRTILGAAPVARASISVDGQSAQRWDPARFLRAGVAMVPEGRGMLSGLTVEENLRMGGYILSSRSELAERIEQALTMFGRLRERLSAPAGVLSGGEQQMLAVARALVSRPRYLLLDEPSMGLAPNIVQTLMNDVRQLVDEGMGVLLVEQNANAALSVADSGHVLERGEIVLSDSAEQLRSSAAVRDAYLGVGGVPAG